MPAAESGTEYKSLDARCRACVVMGGEEQPCMPPHFLEAEERNGYPCPRREWTGPGDPVIAQLVQLGARHEQAHLFREVFEAYFGDEPRRERQRILRMIFRAYGDEVVGLALWPQKTP